MEQPLDEELAKRVQNSDQEAFAVLVERYEEKIRRYGKKFLANGHDIEDLVQDIFLKAYVNIQSFNISMKFSPWIYRIAHNEYINAMKKNSRLPLLAFDMDALFPNLFAPETADQAAQDRELRELVDRGLEKLEAKYREPLVLYYMEDLSYQEISDVLRVPIATIGVRINRAKKLLHHVYNA